MRKAARGIKKRRQWTERGQGWTEWTSEIRAFVWHSFSSEPQALRNTRNKDCLVFHWSKRYWNRQTNSESAPWFKRIATSTLTTLTPLSCEHYWTCNPPGRPLPGFCPCAEDSCDIWQRNRQQAWPDTLRLSKISQLDVPWWKNSQITVTPSPTGGAGWSHFCVLAGGLIKPTIARLSSGKCTIDIPKTHWGRHQ